MAAGPNTGTARPMADFLELYADYKPAHSSNRQLMRDLVTTLLFLSLQGGLSVTDAPFNSPADGVTDEIAAGAFQAAHDALPATGGVIIVPPKSYKVDGTGATIAAPRILCNVTKPNVWFFMLGAQFTFTGMSAAAMAAQNDGGGGFNVFSGIVFGTGVIGGGVIGGNVVGDSDGTAVTNSRSRAKFVAIDGAEDVMVAFLRGKLIVGNLVNARGGAFGLATYKRITIIACHAEACAESGFNYMGGGTDCTFAVCTSRLNKYHGMESGADRSSFSGNVLCDNTGTGLTLVGSHNTCSANNCDGNANGYSCSALTATHNVFTGGSCSRNTTAGVIMISAANYNTVDGTHVLDNGTPGFANGDGVKVNSGSTTIRFCLKNCMIGDTGTGAQKNGINIAGGCTGANITGNTCFGNSVRAIVTNSSFLSSRVTNNDFADPVSTSSIQPDATNFLRNNSGFKTENAGTAVITGATTSIVVTHGSSYGGSTTLADVSCCPVSGLGAAAKWWISTLTSTQFTINVDAAPGSAVTFKWALNIQR